MQMHGVVVLDELLAGLRHNIADMVAVRQYAFAMPYEVQISQTLPHALIPS